MQSVVGRPPLGYPCVDVDRWTSLIIFPCFSKSMSYSSFFDGLWEWRYAAAQMMSSLMLLSRVVQNSTQHQCIVPIKNPYVPVLSSWFAALAHWAGTRFGRSCFLIRESGQVCLGSGGSRSRLSDVDSGKSVFASLALCSALLQPQGAVLPGSNPLLIS